MRFRISAPAATALAAGLLTATALSAGVAAASSASAATVGPGQYFVGAVDGRVTSPAPIAMSCFGPVTPGQTGHPMAGQSVEVLPPTTNAGSLGFTGSRANAINVSIVYSQGTVAHVVPIGTLFAYGIPVDIPTSLVLPCYGSATAVFDPAPTSPSARAADLTVTFVGQP